jgi:hypothetical protein
MDHFLKKLKTFTWRRMDVVSRESFFKKIIFSFTWRRMDAGPRERNFSKKIIIFFLSENFHVEAHGRGVT